MTVVTPKRYNLIEGDIASVDIKAPRDIIDEEALRQKNKKLRKGREKIYLKK